MALMWSFILLLTVSVDLVSNSVITLERNGYKGVVVAIHKDVPENYNLVRNIKSMLTDASSFLHKATRRRAYFDEVTIVVPSKWNLQNDYEIVQGGDRFTHAHVQVVAPSGGGSYSTDGGSGGKKFDKDYDSSEHYASTEAEAPYTKQPGECGEEGQYIRLTTEFVGDKDGTKDGHFGPPGKAFVHEWAHFRYGVFDEHGLEGDESSPAFYADENNNIKPTGCSEDVRGWLWDEGGTICLLDADGLPGSNCAFYPDENTTTAKASIMYLPGLPSVDGFCDDTPERKHNPVAPNKHNLMCEGRSTWDVVSSHEDFKDGRNQPRNMHTTPTFRVIQPKKNERPTFVLVLDTSASMRGKRIDLLRAATSRFIKYQLKDFSTVGMVGFSTNSSVLADMTDLDDETRDGLLTKVPNRDDNGFTAIGKGILTALDLLKDSNEPTEGTLLLLVSDGEENVEPYLSSIMAKIQKARVIINTVAFGRHASSKLEKLVKITGGRGFFYDDEKVSHKVLDSAFIESAATHADLELQPVEIVSKFMSLENLESKEGHFLIDQDVGRNVEIILTYDYPSVDAVEFKVKSPSGKEYNSKSPEYKSDQFTLSVRIKLAKAESGKWHYWVKNKEDALQDTSVVVTSEALDIKEQPVRVRSWVSDVDFQYPQKVKVYAEVKKGERAIVEASVIATISRPQGDPHIMMLYDNGIGADTLGNDGVYSGYFAHFNGSGRYSVEAVIVNNGLAKVKYDGSVPEGSRAPRHHRLPPNAVVNGTAKDVFSPEELEKSKYSTAQGSGHGGKEEDYVTIHQFERFTAAGAFKLEGWKEDEDLIPPARVTDLKIDEATIEEWTVSLSWTSAGDDMDDGKATSIELKYHWDAAALHGSFEGAMPVEIGHVIAGSLSPITGRRKHKLVLRVAPLAALLGIDDGGDKSNVTWPGGRLYFAVRTTDEAGNKAHVSNMAEARFRYTNPPEPREAPSDPMFMEKILWGLLVCLMVLVVVVGVTLCACRLRAKRRTRKYECRDAAARGCLINDGNTGKDPRC